MEPGRDLGVMLATLSVERRPGTYTYVTVAPCDAETLHHELASTAEAVIEEREGRTFVVDQTVAKTLGVEHTFVAVWLSLTVHSALDAVGLTAAVSAALADAGIACNVLAGYFHDHLLVPADRADDAIATLARLQTAAST